MTARRPAVAPAAVAACALLVLVTWAWGQHLSAGGAILRLGAPPLYGRWDPRPGPSLLWGLGVAAAVIAAAPWAVRRAPWPVLLAGVAVGSAGFAVALALIDGPDELTQPLTVSTQYLRAVWMIDGAGDFLAHFVERIDLYPSHVRAHPPAFVLALWGLERAGLGGPGPAAALILVAAASAGPAALIALRQVAGEAAARRAAPFLVLGASALTVATTADALYMALGALGVCALVRGIETRADGWSLVGGTLLGLTAFCSYGLVLLGLVPLGLAGARRRVRPLVVAAAGAALVAGAFAAAGFWWWDGFAATRREYAQSVAMHRPYAYFVVANLAAFAVWLGPAIILALARLRDRRVWLLAGGGLAAVAVADLSGLSKAEVERIWLPFLPWVALAAAALPSGPRAMRALLAAQAAVALFVAATVSSQW